MILHSQKIHRALEEFAFLHYDDESLIDGDFQLKAGDGGRSQPPLPQGNGTQSNRDSIYGLSRDLHRPVLSMPPIILMGAPGGVVTPSPIVEMPPSPAANQMLIVEFPCETIEGVFLNSEDLLDDDLAIIDGDTDDDGDENDTDVGQCDLDEDCYFAEGAVEVRRRMLFCLTFERILVVCFVSPWMVVMIGPNDLD